MRAGRDPIDRLVDVMVATPICTYVAARRTIPLVGRAVRSRLLPAAEMVTDAASDLVDVAVESASDAAPDPSVIDAATSSPDDAAGVTEADTLPIDDYDHLAARQVVDRLDGLTSDELIAVERYELAHRHRQTVLRKIEQQRS